MAEGEFSLFEWSAGIPLLDDLWLGMQARNIAMVDLAVLRHLERDALDAFMEQEKTPVDRLMPLQALSQMWVFSLYEFLRTWRQRAKELISLHQSIEGLSDKERTARIEEIAKQAAERGRLVRRGRNRFSEHAKQAEDATFIGQVEAHMKQTENLFREAEILRVTLAKHEVPRTRGLFAEAPGYARMSYGTGSIYWDVVLKDDSAMVIDRRPLGDEFLGFEDVAQGVVPDLDDLA